MGTLHLKLVVTDDMSPSLSKVLIDNLRVTAENLSSAGKRWKIPMDVLTTVFQQGSLSQPVLQITNKTQYLKS